MKYLQATIVTPNIKIGLPRQAARKEDQTLNKLSYLRNQTYPRVLE
jgi:hypothetical protein